MNNTFNNIIKIDTTVIGNQTINGLKQVPLLKYLYNEKLYASSFVVTIFAFIGMILKAIKEISFNFAITFGFLVIPLLAMLKGEMNMQVSHVYLSVLFTIPLVCMITSKAFKATESKYTNVILLRLDAKLYFIADILKNTIYNMVISIFPLLLILVMFGNIVFNIEILLIYYFISSFFVNLLFLFVYSKKDLIIRDNNFLHLFIVFAGLIIPFFLLLINISLSLELFLLIITTIGVITLMLYSWFKKDDSIYRLYKRRFSVFNNVIDEEDISLKKFEKTSKIEYTDTDLIKKEHGYRLFNDLFFKRHKDLIYNSSLSNNILITIVFVCLITLTLLLEKTRPYVADFIYLRYLNLSLLILFSNRGTDITKTMFFHCDQYMLNYNFYRNKKIIKNVFLLRLKSLIKNNLLTAILLILGINITYYCCGHFEPLTMLCITINTLLLSSFFSIFYLSIYYIIQPYSKSMKEKNIFYFLIIMTTVYAFMLLAENVSLDIISLTLYIIPAVIILSIILIILVILLAPKNFKLK